MTTRITTKGQVVIPCAVRERLGLVRGSRMNVEVNGDRVILTPIRQGEWRRLHGLLRDLPDLMNRFERDHEADRLKEEEKCN